jgi:hypothetical protein
LSAQVGKEDVLDARAPSRAHAQDVSNHDAARLGQVADISYIQIKENPRAGGDD